MLVWVCLLGWVMPVEAQKLAYDVDFVLDFDNMESHHPYVGSGTLFGVRLTPTIGVDFCDSVGGTHRLMAGVSYVQPFGADWREARVMPTVYYRYSVQGFRLHFGFVPYRLMQDALPDYLMSDRLAFTYPNIQGALFDYRSEHGYAELLADWRGMMTDSVREAFRIVGGGRYRYQWLYMGGYAQLNHLSHSERVLGVVDDIVVNPLVGVSLADLTPLDSLALQVGYLMGWQRDRNADDSRLAHGLHLDASLRWRFIGLRNEFYYGDNQMPFYGQYGTLCNQGDAHYQARIYNRTDLYLYLIRLPFVTAWVGWNMLYVDGYGLSHQQQLMCRFNLEECMHFARLNRDERRREWRSGRRMRVLTYR